ncbi:ABC transporter substrate-binding protein [Burkholderia sp. Ac-20379]|uniref:ABC transporter substrate-binding protein n=1 Tax=Burkholderia sp. Ac-20379 TaxID=2703900 RepID=UPI00197DC26D|nr:ABC transporter substrate-binding protein [Burkholderia sp. Ac-20379]MBN3724638.1 ABC transporter substrate-binding protein [Burkholderia sp. Ac-20379]
MLSKTRRQFLQAALLAVPAIGAPPVLAATPATRASRVATTDRAATESLLALGMRPVGAPAGDFYASMGGEPPLPAGIPITGEPIEPNLEVLMSLSPDLIVTGTTSESVRRMLARVAPVMDLGIYNGEPGAYDRAIDGFRRLAALVGRTRQADDYVTALDAKIARIAAALPPRNGRPAYLVTMDGSGRSVVVYSRNSIMYDVMKRIGIPNAWEGRTNGFGFATVGVEQLVAHPDADLIYVNYGSDTRTALEQLATSPFWTNLPMVRAGRLYPIPLFDVYGSLPLASTFADNLGRIFIEPEARHG